MRKQESAQSPPHNVDILSCREQLLRVKKKKMMKQQKRNCYCLDEKKGEWKIKRNKKPNLNYGNNGEKKKNVFFLFFFRVFVILRTPVLHSYSHVNIGNAQERESGVYLSS